MEPLLQKMADILQMTVDKVTEMYPTLVQEASWYTIFGQLRVFIICTIVVSIIAAVVLTAVAEEFTTSMDVYRSRVKHIITIELILIMTLLVIYAVLVIVGPLVYPNINLFTHLFK